MYISGGISLSVGLVGNPIAIELAGTGTQLISWTGGVGYSVTIAAAPSILLLGGAIEINLASIAQATSSLYFKYVNANDFTVALQATVTLNPGDFLGALPLLLLMHTCTGKSCCCLWVAEGHDLANLSASCCHTHFLANWLLTSDVGPHAHRWPLPNPTHPPDAQAPSSPACPLWSRRR